MNIQTEQNRTTGAIATDGRPASGAFDAASDNMNRAATDLGRAAEHTGDALRNTKEGVQTAASGAAERAKSTVQHAGNEAADAVSGAAADVRQGVQGAVDATSHVAQRVRAAEADTQVKDRVASKTEQAFAKAGDAIAGTGPKLAQGVETVADKVGSALHAVGGTLGPILGGIAGAVGGWWNSASEAVSELSEEDEQACRVHFQSYTLRPVGMTYESARPAYTVGYIAARNPSYSGRRFEEIEPDLRHGFGGTPDSNYDSLREFARYGYERGIGTRSGTVSGTSR